jgi:hypothetical protein
MCGRDLLPPSAGGSYCQARGSSKARSPLRLTDQRGSITPSLHHSSTPRPSPLISGEKASWLVRLPKEGRRTAWRTGDTGGPAFSDTHNGSSNADHTGGVPLPCDDFDSGRNAGIGNDPVRIGDVSDLICQEVIVDIVVEC